MMNYGDLKQAWIEWSHRRDLTDTVIANIELMCRSRLARDLRTDANTHTVTQDFSTGSDDMSVLLTEVTLMMDSHYRVYEYVAPNQFNPKNNDYTYTQYGTKLHVTPATDEMTVIGFGDPGSLQADDDTNDVLSFAPNLYIYAGLTEIFRFIQDRENMVVYTQQYQAEIAKANEAGQRRRIGNNPVMRAI